MHIQARKTRPAMRAIPGRHAKGALSGKAARKILVPAVLGSLAVGSAAAVHYASATGSVSAHHRTEVSVSKNVPWMY
jgi:hypothetical protein